MAKLTCPHCGEHIGRRLLRGKPLSGERKFLPNRAILVCPFCERELHANPHPAEMWSLLVFLPFFFLFELRATLEKAWVIGGLLVWLVVAVSVIAFVHYKYLRDWPRFSARPNLSLKKKR